MISVLNVSKAFGPKKLFEDVDVTFTPGNRYGLTGPNGSGRSGANQRTQKDPQTGSHPRNCLTARGPLRDPGQAR